MVSFACVTSAWAVTGGAAKSRKGVKKASADEDRRSLATIFNAAHLHESGRRPPPPSAPRQGRGRRGRCATRHRQSCLGWPRGWLPANPAPTQDSAASLPHGDPVAPTPGPTEKTRQTERKRRKGKDDNKGSKFQPIRVLALSCAYLGQVGDAGGCNLGLPCQRLAQVCALGFHAHRVRL